MAFRHFDSGEAAEPALREQQQLEQLRVLIAAVRARHPTDHRLDDIDPASIQARDDLARIPVLRKRDLPALQAAAPPFGGLAAMDPDRIGRLFMSPGGIFEPEGVGSDWWGAARAFHAAGFRRGDIVLNTFSYHLTPGGFILDSGARALGCPVIPAGPGNTEAQLELIQHYRPVGYAGTPDFLKILLDAALAAGKDAGSIVKALVSGAALPASLRADLEGRGVAVRQAYASADFGVIAYETTAPPDGRLVDGMTVAEGLIVEIVRPGTDDPVLDGEVGEVVISRLDPVYPLIRFGTGDLSAVLFGSSACGRSNMRLQGWMGRADQRTKVKGMFVDPQQVHEVAKRHKEIQRARLVVSRIGEQDSMTLQIETTTSTDAFVASVSASVAAVIKLKGAVELVEPGALPNDGKVIVDRRM